MIMKGLQILGNVIPVLLTVFAYVLFGDPEPDTPNYTGAVMAMLWMFGAMLAVGFVLLFILPSSIILLTTENRQYFSFNSTGWLSVLVVNWLFIAFYFLCIIAFVWTSGR